METLAEENLAELGLTCPHVPSLTSHASILDVGLSLLPVPGSSLHKLTLLFLDWLAHRIVCHQRQLPSLSIPVPWIK